MSSLTVCTVWLLAFFMQAGFALVEAGFTRAKNVVNIFMKNLLDFSLGSIVFWAVGFGLMFGTSSGVFGTDSFFRNNTRSAEPENASADFTDISDSAIGIDTC